MKKVYVIGSSSKIAQSLEKYLPEEYTRVFIGRSNSFKLPNFVVYNGITDEQTVEDLSQMITKDLKNSPGIKEASLIILSGVSTHNWRESFLVNEYLPAKLSEEFAQYISRLGVPGSISLISSTAAYQGAKLAYATTKASLTGILHTISRDYKNLVRINIILPSAFESGMISDWDDEKRKSVASNNYIGRLANADDIASAVEFTITNKFITNSTINMSGGTVHI